jgi:hypothetical protein
MSCSSSCLSSSSSAKATCPRRGMASSSRRHRPSSVTSLSSQEVISSGSISVAPGALAGLPTINCSGVKAIGRWAATWRKALPRRIGSGSPSVCRYDAVRSRARQMETRPHTAPGCRCTRSRSRWTRRSPASSGRRIAASNRRPDHGARARCHHVGYDWSAAQDSMVSPSGVCVGQGARHPAVAGCAKAGGPRGVRSVAAMNGITPRNARRLIRDRGGLMQVHDRICILWACIS